MIALLLCASLQQPAPGQIVPAQGSGDEDMGAMGEVVRELARQGVRFDPARGLIELDAKIAQLYEPLEYLIVARPRGKDYEALFAVEKVSAQALNTALLLAGLEPGRNGTLQPVDPPPTPEQMDQGVAPYTVQPASGPGMYLYAWWERENPAAPGAAPERYFYRAEDLVLNARSERTYQRGPWVYLGSRFVKPHKDAEEMFAAEAEGNFVSVVYFDPANHLLTGADPEADNQYVWYPNFYLLPEIGHPVKLLLSREPLDAPPPTVQIPQEAAPGG